MPLLDIAALVERQAELTVQWHSGPVTPSGDGAMAAMEENHGFNFQLWHEEDRARRDDLGFEHVYRAKRAIDRLNQQRNNAVERLDDWLAAAAGPFPEGCPMHSETPGMIVDRLSILALKAYHMREEAERPDASDAHRSACAAKLATILRQRGDLAAALTRLIGEIEAKTRGFRLYRQFKMYNDPALNPELYRRSGG